MISNIGCEDMAGVLWQWSRDPGGVYSSGASWANAYDGNDSGVAGQHYQAPYRALLGGSWNYGSMCGSRSSSWYRSPLNLDSYKSGRGCAEPAANRL
jgi:formylglycine-generating enzyme required for sulfatase activity